MSSMFDKKLQEEKERNQEVCLWLSFSGNDGFKGVIITKTLGLSHAIKKTHEMGINPNGQLMSSVIDPSTIKPEDFDKLMNAEYLIKNGYGESTRTKH